MLYIEPDGYEDLQDELDVASMDLLVSDLAALTRLNLDNDDLPARLNERGFAILARRPDSASLEALADKLLTAWRGHIIEIGDRAFSISCSIGLGKLGRLVDGLYGLVGGFSDNLKLRRTLLEENRRLREEAARQRRGAMEAWRLKQDLERLSRALDYVGTEERLGKPVCSDLVEGKVTLPRLVPPAAETIAAFPSAFVDYFRVRIDPVKSGDTDSVLVEKMGRCGYALTINSSGAACVKVAGTKARIRPA